MAAAAAACKRVSYTLLGPPAERLRASVSAAASGAPCLDFFFRVVPDTPAATVTSLLSAAWAAEPNTALRLAYNLRGVRGTGKSDREGFYASALWMYDNHPNTLALNAASVAKFGYLKDLLELLHRIIHGGVSTMTPRPARTRSYSYKPREKPDPATREARIAASQEHDRKLSEQAAMERRKKSAEAAARAVERYDRDPKYRFLHDRTADLFADLIAEDMKKLEEYGKVANPHLSLASKWCPSLNKCYDRSTLLCESIGRRLFPKGSAPDLPEDLPDEYYAYRVRERLRKMALVPLRRALHLPEVYISARRWADVVYSRVASVAMKNYTDLFLEHDNERFNIYLANVKSVKAKIAAGALLPHEILKSIDYYDNESNEVANLQWKRMVDDLLELGKLNNCLAVCDVSGSMDGLPLDVCVALGLLLSELCDEPWHHRVITFSERPRLHHIKGETLLEKTEFICRMDWHLNTDFQAVFDKLLDVAVSGNLPPERMVKKVFVFSDMEFDEASSRPWETDYEAITRKFTEAGYGDAIPEVVFWNLRDSSSVPVTANQKRVALVSGYSKNMVKLFLSGRDMLTPRAVMEGAISGREYEELVVFD
uniref:Uncharacterized protein n=1 Tax=Oryza brachyantha TaxID=4533 RepID=J3MGD4_ORYBR